MQLKFTNNPDLQKTLDNYCYTDSRKHCNLVDARGMRATFLGFLYVDSDTGLIWYATSCGKRCMQNFHYKNNKIVPFGKVKEHYD